MNNFGLDKNYSQLNFEEITVEDLVIVSGGSGGGSFPWEPYIPYIPFIGFPPITNPSAPWGGYFG